MKHKKNTPSVQLLSGGVSKINQFLRNPQLLPQTTNKKQPQYSEAVNKIDKFIRKKNAHSQLAFFVLYNMQMKKDQLTEERAQLHFKQRLLKTSFEGWNKAHPITPSVQSSPPQITNTPLQHLDEHIFRSERIMQKIGEFLVTSDRQNKTEMSPGVSTNRALSSVIYESSPSPQKDVSTPQVIQKPKQQVRTAQSSIQSKPKQPTPTFTSFKKKDWRSPLSKTPPRSGTRLPRSKSTTTTTTAGAKISSQAAVVVEQITEQEIQAEKYHIRRKLKQIFFTLKKHFLTFKINAIKADQFLLAKYADSWFRQYKIENFYEKVQNSREQMNLQKQRKLFFSWYTHVTNPAFKQREQRKRIAKQKYQHKLLRIALKVWKHFQKLGKTNLKGLNDVSLRRHIY